MPSDFKIHEVQWTPETIRRFWTCYASTAHGEHAHFSSLFGEQIVSFAQRVGPLSGLRVLDYGCGPGFMIERLLHCGARAEGLEFSPESAEKARKRCEGHPLFRGVALVQKLPSSIQAASVDVVLLIEVLEHLQDDQIGQTLEDIRRMLRVGGHLVLTTPHNENLERMKTICPDCGCVFHPWQHVGSFTEMSLSQLLGRHGMRGVFCEATNFSARCYSKALQSVRKLFLGPRAQVGQPHLVYIGQRVI